MRQQTGMKFLFLFKSLAEIIQVSECSCFHSGFCRGFFGIYCMQCNIAFDTYRTV